MNAKQEIENYIKFQKEDIEVWEKELKKAKNMSDNGYLEACIDNLSGFKSSLHTYKHCLSLIEQEEEERKCENCIESIVCQKKILTEYPDENGDMEKISIIPITYCSNFKHKDKEQELKRLKGEL